MEKKREEDLEWICIRVWKSEFSELFVLLSRKFQEFKCNAWGVYIMYRFDFIFSFCTSKEVCWHNEIRGLNTCVYSPYVLHYNHYGMIHTCSLNESRVAHFYSFFYSSFLFFFNCIHCVNCDCCISNGDGDGNGNGNGMVSLVMTTICNKIEITCQYILLDMEWYNLLDWV